MQEFIGRLTAMGLTPSDNEEARLKKALLTYIATLISLTAVFWGAVYLTLGDRWPGAILLAYAAASGASLVLLAATKRYRLFRVSQLLLILILPALLQWSLGGYDRNSTVVMWAILSPLGAMMFSSPRAARPWFFAFLVVVAITGFGDPWMHARGATIPRLPLLLFYVLNLAIFSTVVFVLLRHFVQEREQAKRRSEHLLLNILPAPIAERLKASPDTIADAFEDVSVVFADLVDFSHLSSSATPHQLVSLLNEVFSTFDQLAERHGLEKIKTIGDAYMVVGGLPQLRPGHLEAAAEMALDMRECLATFRAPDGQPLHVRIGLHVGPAVAGVIGKRKFIYDLWGDTVNTASRMESHGTPGAIHVTEAAYQRLKSRYAFTPRGAVAIKGKGDLTTYFLTDRLAPPQ